MASGGLVSKLRIEVGERGLDIVHPFPARSLLRVLGRSSSTKECELTLRENALCVLVGNSKLLWDPFLLHLKENKGRIGLNPLDDFVEAIIEQALENLESPAADRCSSVGQETHKKDNTGNSNGAAVAYYSNKKYREFGDNYLPIQRLAHAVGLAWLSEECHMCLHEDFGPWFSLRALVVLRDVDYDGSDPPPLRSKLTERGSEELKDQLNKALRSSKTEEWIELRSLAARLVGCDGENVRYSEQQISYHYYKQDKDALAKLLLSETGIRPNKSK